MSSERWARIKHVFNTVLDMPEEDRAGFLNRTCGSDDSLREEIESLLRNEAAGETLDRAPEALAEGSRLGPYEIVTRVGAGGMGTVYKARDTRLDRLVAIKIVRNGTGGRLQNEARAAAALSHPHICALHDVGPNYLVMEYLEGRTLAARLREGPLRFEETVQYGIQVADALAAAHAQGIVHRDLKPANIVLTGSGAKVLDFGLAQRATAESTMTAEGGVAGTLNYLSPEQAEGKSVDARSDIFSFGAVLYEMATGRRAFQGDSGLATVAAILRAEPPMYGVAPELAAVIRRCLEKHASRRFQSAGEVKAALMRIQSETSPLPGRHRHWPRVLGVVAILLVVLVAIRQFSARMPATGDLQVVPLTGLPGLAIQASLSPDGTKVAFIWGGERQDNADIYVRQIGSTGQLRLTTDPRSEADPVWSPDDRYIAFTRPEPDGSVAIMLIPPLGGPERKVAAVLAAKDQNRRICWTPDAKWLAVSCQSSFNEASAIWLYSVDGGEHKRLTLAKDHAAVDSNPAFSPDGKWLAFSRGGGHYWVRPFVQELSSGWTPRGAARPLTTGQYYELSGISWTADSRAIVYGAGEDSHLWRVPVRGDRAPVALNFAAPAAVYPAISGGRFPRLVYTCTTSGANIWRLDTRTGERKPWIVSRGRQILAHYSPDGRKIVFESTRSGTTQVWTCDADGTNCAQLTFGDRATGGPQWSPDSRWLVLSSNIEGGPQVHTMRADGGAMRQLTFGGGLNGSASWSHDGRWIYYQSGRDGRAAVWKVPAAGGNPTQLTFAGGAVPAEGFDGKYVYFLERENGGPVLRVPAEGGAEEEVVPDVAGRYAWTLGRRGIYFVPPGKPPTIQFREFATGKTRTIAQLDGLVGAGFSVSPDENYILFSRLDRFGADLMLVENFR